MLLLRLESERNPEEDMVLKSWRVTASPAVLNNRITLLLWKTAEIKSHPGKQTRESVFSLPAASRTFSMQRRVFISGWRGASVVLMSAGSCCVVVASLHTRNRQDQRVGQDTNTGGFTGTFLTHSDLSDQQYLDQIQSSPRASTHWPGDYWNTKIWIIGPVYRRILRDETCYNAVWNREQQLQRGLGSISESSYFREEGGAFITSKIK